MSAVETPPGELSARGARRLAALGIDWAVLTAGVVFATAFGVALAEPATFYWLWGGWLLLVAPLYFALYHAFGGPEGGPGATPGEHEVGLVVRSSSTGERMPLGRAIARAYAGLAWVLLIVPAVVELAGHGRSWRDRLTDSEVRYIAGSGRLPLVPTPTDSGVTGLFEPAATKPGAMRRAWRLVRLYPRQVVAPVVVSYLGLVALAGVLVPMVVLDVRAHAADAVVGWFVYAVIAVLSGIYWTQSVIVTAVEAVRVGEDRSIRETVRRASVRANALTASLIFGYAAFLLIAALPLGVFVALFLAPRLALVPLALVLEDRSVLGSVRRSWRLAEGHGRRLATLTLASIGVLAVAVPLTLAAPLVVASPFTGGTPTTAATALLASLALASLPLSVVLAVLGSAWCLLYYELRNASAPQRETEAAP